MMLNIAGPVWTVSLLVILSSQQRSKLETLHDLESHSASKKEVQQPHSLRLHPPEHEVGP